MRTLLPKKNHPYPYVVMWCRFMGSYAYYTDIITTRAKEQNAPKDAVYQMNDSYGRETGAWVTLSEVKNKSFLKACELWQQGKLQETDGWPMA